MGIAGLWQAIEAARVLRTLDVLVLVPEYSGRRGVRGMIIGIDASAWMHQMMHSLSLGHAQAGENAQLRTLCLRLNRLLPAQVHAVFVFDGPARPSRKRNINVCPKPVWLTTGFKDLVEAYGFKYHDAPGEAEAELAKMNREGYIDAIMTDDSDVFAFGAQTVIRNSSFNASSSQLAIYYAHAIRASPTVGLSHGDFIMITLLCGGDYDPSGYPGIGIETAIALARYGLGDLLFAIALAPNHPDYEVRIQEWRTLVQDTLRNDPLGHIGRNPRVVANTMPPTFPQRAVLLAYVDPKTSDFDMPKTIFRSHIPDVGRLTALFERHFTWGTFAGITKFIHDRLWRGIAVRILMENAIFLDQVPGTPGWSASIDNRTYLLNVKVVTANIDPAPPAVSRVRIEHGSISLIIITSLAGLRGHDTGKGGSNVHNHLTAVEAQASFECDVPSSLLILAQPGNVAKWVKRQGGPHASPGHRALRRMRDAVWPQPPPNADIIDLTATINNPREVIDLTGNDVINLTASSPSCNKYFALTGDNTVYEPGSLLNHLIDWIDLTKDEDEPLAGPSTA